MSRNIYKVFSIFAAVLFLSVTVLELEAFARAGGGRSSGSRGSRSYSSPSRSYTTPSTPKPAPVQPTVPQQPGGGFWRSFGGGLVGGLVGGMLFRSLGFGGFGGGFGGSGIGLFEIILIAGIGYFIYRMVKRRREDNLAYQSSQYQQDTGYSSTGMQQSYGTGGQQAYQSDTNDLERGLSHIRQMDPYFDESRFSDNAMDIFFKIQSGWMNRNLSPVSGLFTDEMRRIFQDDIDRMLRERKLNKLENIAVRNVEIVEAWQETGQDFVTVRIYANLLDYTVDEATGNVIEGNKAEPVKFEEYWTFTRTVGNNPWKLSGINQA